MRTTIRYRMQTTSFLEHPAEEALERYVLHQSPEAELETVETHIMACENCVERLEQVELQISATKLALQQLHLEKVAKSYAAQQTRRRGWLSMPKLSLAGGLAMVALAFSVLPGLHDRMKPAVNVQLTAYRGVESRILPKDRTLHLTLNASGLTGALASVTLVDSNGVEVWKTAAPIRENVVTVDVPQIHATGTHFFRLYQSGQDSDQLREFSVIIE
jgi:anti-sigma factor RsiW